EQSAAWLLNGKAIAHQVLAERNLRQRDQRDPGLKDLSSQLLEVRQRLATLTQQRPPPGQEVAHRTSRDTLVAAEEKLSRELGQRLAVQGPAPSWVELAVVRQAIPKGAV